MPEFLTGTVNRVAQLAPNASAEIQFDPGHAGTLVLRCNAGRVRNVPHRPRPPRPGDVPGGHDPDVELQTVARRLELLRPDRTVAASRTEDVLGSTLQHALTEADASGASKWTFKVTNTSSASAKFTLSAAFPTATELKSAEIPVSLVNALLPGLLGLSALRGHLESGENDGDKRSFFDVGAGAFRDALVAAGVALPMRFAVPKVTISIPVLADPVARVRDVNVQDVSLSLENANAAFAGGFVQVVARFEETGTEIVVDNGPDADMRHMTLTVKFGVTAVDGKLAYGLVDADFPVDVDIHGPLAPLINLFVNVSKKVRREVESQVEGMLDQPSARNTASTQITNTVRSLPAFGFTPSSRIQSARVEAGLLKIKFTDS